MLKAVKLTALELIDKTVNPPNRRLLFVDCTLCLNVRRMAVMHPVLGELPVRPLSGREVFICKLHRICVWVCLTYLLNFNLCQSRL